MDPLSISASVIALCGAVASVSKGLRYVASIRKAPIEFLDLQNQLQTLQGYLSLLGTALDAIGVPTSSLPPPDLVHVGLIVQSLTDDIKSLKEVAQGFEVLAKGRTNSKGQPVIPKLKWQREMATISLFRERIVQKRGEIADCLRLLQPSQTFVTILMLAQATFMVDIRTLTETNFENLNLLINDSTHKMHSLLTVLEEKLERGLPEAGPNSCKTDERQANVDRSGLVQCVDGMKDMVQTMKRRNDESDLNNEETSIEVAAGYMRSITSALETASRQLDKREGVQVNDPAPEDLRQLLEASKIHAARSYDALGRSVLARDFRKTTSVDQHKNPSPTNLAALSGSPLPSTQQQWPFAGPEFHGSDETTKSGTWNLRTTVRMRCPTNCKCQCHAVTTSRTPSILSRMLGTIILSYNSVAVWDSRPCNHPKCLKNSSNSVHLNYLFPVWLLRMSIAFSISWDSVVGSGASLYLSLPRVISASLEVFKAIDTNNVPRLQRLFSERMFFPTDINEDGVCLLTYALYVVKSWPAAKLLLDIHPRVVHRDNHGNAPVSIASWKFYVHGHHLESEVNGLYRRIMDLGDEESHSTIIHDSVIARTRITVEEALNLEPQSLDAMDNFGLTALQWAVLRNNTHATKTILAWRPKLELCDFDGRTALHRAAEFGLLDCAKMLLDAGANVNACDAWGDTPLHLATTLPDTKLLALLLADGNAAVMANRYGRTPMHGSVLGRFPDDEAVLHDLLEMLRNAGASIDAQDLDGMTPIIVAVQQSHVAMFRTLRRHGAVIEVPEMCVKQRTVFHIAAMFSTVDMIQKLRDEEITTINPDAKDETGLTATDYFTGRATFAQSELSEGQQQVASEELEPFIALMSETRARYQSWARKVQLGPRTSDHSLPVVNLNVINASQISMKTDSLDSEDEYYDSLEQ